MGKQRIYRITGYLVFNDSDIGYNWSKSDIAESLTGLQELTVTEMPNAIQTGQGIRTDQ